MTGETFFFYGVHPDRLRGTASFLLNRYRSCFLGVKRPGRDVDHPFQSITLVNNVSIYTSAPPIRFHCVDRETFIYSRYSEVHDIFKGLLCFNEYSVSYHWDHCLSFPLRVRWLVTLPFTHYPVNSSGHVPSAVYSLNHLFIHTPHCTGKSVFVTSI
jgi:hypothetical protein